MGRGDGGGAWRVGRIVVRVEGSGGVNDGREIGRVLMRVRWEGEHMEVGWVGGRVKTEVMCAAF